jgi:hypothetical protein
LSAINTIRNPIFFVKAPRILDRYYLGIRSGIVLDVDKGKGKSKHKDRDLFEGMVSCINDLPFPSILSITMNNHRSVCRSVPTTDDAISDEAGLVKRQYLL